MFSYKQALHDIHADLKARNKCFIAFRTELNPIMKNIVNNAIKQQEKL